MVKTINEERIKYIVSRLLERFIDAVEESDKDTKDELNMGRRLADYEVLDILRTELEVAELDLKEIGLDIDLESKL